ncbi:MAG TPA: gliding motility lipoprotein GldD [Bacteroidales bacterium]|nr:gliding motility lipoprotein GldD [Bacteroidales bacterium]
MIHKLGPNFKKAGRLTALLGFVFLLSCQDYYQPKARGYVRIFLPQKEYKRTQDTLPYIFDIPVYSNFKTDQHPFAEKYWTNLEFPMFKAKLHLSYKPVENNLNSLLEDAYKLANKHIPKANAIQEQLYVNKEKSVYGLTFLIKGTEAASPYQFFVTDSTHHFLRGALYFNVRPNNDSLAPIIDFLEKDIQRLIESLEWNKMKNGSIKKAAKRK